MRVLRFRNSMRQLSIVYDSSNFDDKFLSNTICTPNTIVDWRTSLEFGWIGTIVSVLQHIVHLFLISHGQNMFRNQNPSFVRFRQYFHRFLL